MREARPALRRSLADGGTLAGRFLHAVGGSVALADIAGGHPLDAPLAAFAGRSVLVATHDQLPSALALVALDGVAARVVLAPPDLRPEHRGVVMAQAAVDVVVTDRDPDTIEAHGATLVARCTAEPGRSDHPGARHDGDTEWVLLTSGTTGAPKLAVHGRTGLTGAIAASADASTIWGTFYDIRRYGGLQIFLRAVLGGGSLVLSQAGEPVAAHLERLAQHGVTHLSGTPSHWRRALMSPQAALIAPRYVRLSGEIADQAVLDALRRAYPEAAIGHAFASTEAGVGFEVTDGREGFPSALVGTDGRAVDMKVEGGSLRIRSARTASRYLGSGAPRLRDADGFVDTDDMVERRGDRWFFVGRRGGIINVGGLKVHPEEVEAVINRHDAVRMSLVKGRANPITGSIVVAEVVLNAQTPPGDAAVREAAVKTEILSLCRDVLPHHKVPVLLRFLPHLPVTAAGKLDRPHA